MATLLPSSHWPAQPWTRLGPRAAFILIAAAGLAGCAWAREGLRDALDCVEASAGSGPGLVLCVYAGMPIGVGEIDGVRVGLHSRWCVGSWREHAIVFPPLALPLFSRLSLSPTWPEAPLIAGLVCGGCFRHFPPPTEPNVEHMLTADYDGGWVALARVRSRSYPPEYSEWHVDLLGSVPLGIEVHIAYVGIRIVVFPLQILELFVNLLGLDMDPALGASPPAGRSGPAPD